MLAIILQQGTNLGALNSAPFHPFGVLMAVLLLPAHTQGVVVHGYNMGHPFRDFGMSAYKDKGPQI